MSRLNRFALAAVAVAFTPQIARAEGPPLSSVQVFCQPGSLNNCFAFAIQSNDGHITYYLQNLQGSIAPGGSAFAINQITAESRVLAGSGSGGSFLYRVTYGPRPAPAGLSFEGNILRGDNIFSEGSNALSFFQRSYLTMNGGVGLIGCVNPLFGAEERLMFIVGQTCLPTGLDGWGRFDAFTTLFTIPTDEALGGAPLEYFYFNVAGCTVYVGAQSGVSASRGTDCSTNINYADLRASFTTVPEPSSIALVASGLVGTGLFGRRRRNRRFVPTSRNHP